MHKILAVYASVIVFVEDPCSFAHNRGKNILFQTDVISSEDVDLAYGDIVATLGMPTILIANAGVYSSKTILDASDGDLRRTFDVNVLGVLFCIKAFLPSMIAANHGHILVTSSIKAYISSIHTTDYSASKAAVTSIVEGLQTELKHKYGNPMVKASAIFPAIVKTRMSEGINPKVNRFIMPLLDPEQVAEQIVKVLSKGER